MSPFRANFDRRTITTTAGTIYLSPSQFSIFTAIWMHGRIHRVQLEDILYGNDINGGPEYNSVVVMTSWINRKLRSMGYKITSSCHMLEIVRL